MHSKQLHVYAIFVACATFFLLIAGGLVTSTGSGLAVPDWPLSFGQFFPEMTGGVFYEHGHRMIATTVGLLTLILAGWIWRVGSPRPLGLLAGLAVGAVCLQGILGGVTVLLKLPVLVSVLHACLGQTFFALVVAIVVFSAPAPDFSGELSQLAKIKRLGILTLSFIFLQLIAGAILRHTGKGLHAHLTGAFLVLVHVQLLSRRVIKNYTLRTGLGLLALGLSLLLIAQLILGYFSWKSGPVAITTAHVGVGALLLAGSLILTLQASRRARISA